MVLHCIIMLTAVSLSRYKALALTRARSAFNREHTCFLHYFSQMFGNKYELICHRMHKCMYVCACLLLLLSLHFIFIFLPYFQDFFLIRWYFLQLLLPLRKSFFLCKRVSVKIRSSFLYRKSKVFGKKFFLSLTLSHSAVVFLN